MRTCVDTADAYRALRFPGAEYLGNMFQFCRDFEAVCRARRDVSASRRLLPTLQTFAQWAQRNRQALMSPASE
jgi:hypothetical protein